MLLRKPGLLFSSYGSLHSSNCLCHHHPLNTSSTSVDHPRARHPRPTQTPQWRRRRGYANVISDSANRLQWPETPHPTAVPTPYQIFCQKKGTPYSKRRFYELVKLYHPDRHGHGPPLNESPARRLSHAVRLERYRLVVAANDILGDPVKRSAYDRYGAGWNGMPEVGGSWRHNTTRYGGASAEERGWGAGRMADDSPSQNATWEDWERWHQRDAKGPQQPLYFANGAFISLIVMLAALGGVGQATRVGNYSMSFLEERDRLHDETSKDLVRRRRETTTAYAHRDERIESFLKTRDPEGYGTYDSIEDGYPRLLPGPDVSTGDDVNGRPMDMYHSDGSKKDR